MISELDPTLHSTVLLQLMTTLSALEEGDEVLLQRLQEVLDSPAEDVLAAASVLIDAGYVSRYEGSRDGAIGNWIGATPKGRSAFRQYMAALAVNLMGKRAS